MVERAPHANFFILKQNLEVLTLYKSVGFVHSSNTDFSQESAFTCFHHTATFLRIIFTKLGRHREKKMCGERAAVFSLSIFFSPLQLLQDIYLNPSLTMQLLNAGILPCVRLFLAQEYHPSCLCCLFGNYASSFPQITEDGAGKKISLLSLWVSLDMHRFQDFYQRPKFSLASEGSTARSPGTAQQL